jgi:hypothetical protein
MQLQTRFHAAFKAAITHLGLSILVALICAGLVFGVWYPFPYRELSGGRELFMLVVIVDIVCGPLLTLVLFNPQKPRGELIRDLGLVAIIQLAALIYGLWSVWQARPLFLINEFDRFKVVAAPEINQFDFTKLPASLQPKLWAGPITAGLRQPKDQAEREKVMFESVQGGADYAERPEFYLPYESEVALASLKRAKPVVDFLKRYPAQTAAVTSIASSAGLTVEALQYVPIIARVDWIALVDKKGMIIGFVPGDGF